LIWSPKRLLISSSLVIAVELGHLGLSGPQADQFFFEPVTLPEQPVDFRLFLGYGPQGRLFPARGHEVGYTLAVVVLLPQQVEVLPLQADLFPQGLPFQLLEALGVLRGQLLQGQVLGFGADLPFLALSATSFWAHS
jgi:hypothetical protein